MTEIVGVVAGFPTVVFTVMLSLAVLYWLFVVIGALDIDTFGGAAGAGKGALEGAAKGAMEGVVKGALEGATKGAMEGVLKGGLDDAAGALVPEAAHAELSDGGGEAGEPAEQGLLATILQALRLRSTPVTVVASLFALFAWLGSGLATLTFGPFGALAGAGVMLGAAVVSLLLTSLVSRPLAPLFTVQGAQKSEDLEGKIAVVSTGEVTTGFGQALLEDGGAGLILQVRTDGSGALRRGDRVVLIEFDEHKGAFLVEKLPSHEDFAAPTGVRVADPAAEAELEAEATREAEQAAKGGR